MPTQPAPTRLNDELDLTCHEGESSKSTAAASDSVGRQAPVVSAIVDPAEQARKRSEKAAIIAKWRAHIGSELHRLNITESAEAELLPGIINSAEYKSREQYLRENQLILRNAIMTMDLFKNCEDYFLAPADLDQKGLFLQFLNQNKAAANLLIIAHLSDIAELEQRLPGVEQVQKFTRLTRSELATYAQQTGIPPISNIAFIKDTFVVVLQNYLRHKTEMNNLIMLDFLCRNHELREFFFHFRTNIDTVSKQWVAFKQQQAHALLVAAADDAVCESASPEPAQKKEQADATNKRKAEAASTENTYPNQSKRAKTSWQNQLAAAKTQLLQQAGITPTLEDAVIHAADLETVQTALALLEPLDRCANFLLASSNKTLEKSFDSFCKTNPTALTIRTDLQRRYRDIQDSIKVKNHLNRLLVQYIRDPQNCNKKKALLNFLCQHDKVRAHLEVKMADIERLTALWEQHPDFQAARLSRIGFFTAQAAASADQATASATTPSPTALSSVR